MVTTKPASNASQFTCATTSGAAKSSTTVSIIFPPSINTSANNAFLALGCNRIVRAAKRVDNNAGSHAASVP